MMGLKPIVGIRMREDMTAGTMIMRLTFKIVSESFLADFGQRFDSIFA